MFSGLLLMSLAAAPQVEVAGEGVKAHGVTFTLEALARGEADCRTTRLEVPASVESQWRACGVVESWQGTEQRFALTRRPAGQGPVRLRLAVDAPWVGEDAWGHRFGRVRYGLAFVLRGDERVPVPVQHVDGGLELVLPAALVDAPGAFPLHVDPQVTLDPPFSLAGPSTGTDFPTVALQPAVADAPGGSDALVVWVDDRLGQSALFGLWRSAAQQDAGTPQPLVVAAHGTLHSPAVTMTVTGAWVAWEHELPSGSTIEWCQLTLRENNCRPSTLAVGRHPRFSTVGGTADPPPLAWLVDGGVSVVNLTATNVVMSRTVTTGAVTDLSLSGSTAGTPLLSLEVNDGGTGVFVQQDLSASFGLRQPFAIPSLSESLGSRTTDEVVFIVGPGISMPIGLTGQSPLVSRFGTPAAVFWAIDAGALVSLGGPGYQPAPGQVVASALAPERPTAPAELIVEVAFNGSHWLHGVTSPGWPELFPAGESLVGRLHGRRTPTRDVFGWLSGRQLQVLTPSQQVNGPGQLPMPSSLGASLDFDLGLTNDALFVASVTAQGTGFLSRTNSDGGVGMNTLTNVRRLVLATGASGGVLAKVDLTNALTTRPVLADGSLSNASPQLAPSVDEVSADCLWSDAGLCLVAWSTPLSALVTWQGANASGSLVGSLVGITHDDEVFYVVVRVGNALKVAAVTPEGMGSQGSTLIPVDARDPLALIPGAVPLVVVQSDGLDFYRLSDGTLLSHDDTLTQERLVGAVGSSDLSHAEGLLLLRPPAARTPDVAHFSLPFLATTDAGISTDAGTAPDAGTGSLDGGSSLDAGDRPDDAGTAPGDAGTPPFDAGVDPEADAGTAPGDAGTPPFDAGVDPGADAGTDGGSAADAGQAPPVAFSVCGCSGAPSLFSLLALGFLRRRRTRR